MANVPGSISANQNLGGSAIFRSDAQIEATNPSAGHALIVIGQTANPGSNVEEAGLSYDAYDSTGLAKQMASISAMWGNDATVSDGYGVLRFNVDGADQSSNVELRIFGRQKGIDIFGAPTPTGEQNPPGGRFIRITRTSGYASICGASDMVLDGTANGSGTIYLNAYSTGDVVVNNGGGHLQFGQPLKPNGPSAQVAWLELKDSTGAIFWVPAWK